MLVEDHVVLIAEDDVAVFSHELDHDEFSPEIAHLIEMLDLDPDDPLHSGWVTEMILPFAQYAFLKA